MDPERWKQIDDLVDLALDIPESDRASFVSSKAGGDSDLERAVLELLAAQGQSNRFLQHSAMQIVAQAIAGEEPRVRSQSLVGRKLATYRIEKLLGAGGMGEVYLAFDEKMRRNVALKILPAEYGSHDERVRRFELEARAISKLNHPNIVTIYDVGNVDGINYIATEFVEGKTLRELIGSKFKLRNVMANSIQICDALSAAHAEGIVHRDIKPENIMIRKDGYAKILDFGVAKLTELGPETIRKLGNTTRGMIIGTPGYMSPAQVSGDTVDHRSDLWGCGVVLYEFLTGKHPFKGKNRQATFQAIISENPPPPSSIDPELPEAIDHILAKVLEKDADKGYQTAADLRADLKIVKRELDSFATSDGHSSSSFTFRRERRSRWPIVVAAAASVLVAVLVTVYIVFLRESAEAKGPDWATASSVNITNQPGIEYFPSLSPDGKDIVFAGEENGPLDIFVQRIGSKRALNLTPGSPADDTQPAFSPGGDLIAFRSEREPAGIYTMEVSGDNLRRVADFGFHPSWSPDGKQLVVSSWGRDRPTVRPQPNEFLAIVDVQSGSHKKLIELEATFPSWSPNGHRIAYWYYTGTYGRRDIATIPAGGGEPVVVAKDFAVSNWNPVWSPDGKFLYFVSGRSGKMGFWRIAIDETTGRTSGEPVAVVTPSTFSRHITFSRDGTRMAYVQTEDTSNIQGVNFDAQNTKPLGDPFWITEGDRELSRAVLSPDGTQFAVRLNRPTQEDIVTVGRDGREWRDVTNDESFERYVRWSPDGKRLAFASDRDSGGEVWTSNADGTGLQRLTYSAVEGIVTGFPVWAPDGRLAVLNGGVTSVLDPTRSQLEQTPEVIPAGPGLTIRGWDWSPDGSKLCGIINQDKRRHIGYYDFNTKKYEIVVPDANYLPAWLPDSRQLIYSDDESKVFLVDIVAKRPRLILTNPRLRIRSPFVSSDGKLLYYTAALLRSDIWLLDLGGKH